MAKRGNREGTIYQDADGRWRAALSLGAGRGRKYFSGDTRAEVAAKLDAARRELALGVAPPPERLTVERFLEDWLRDVLPLRVRPRTLDSARMHIRRHIVPAIGSIPISKLQAGDVQRLVTEKAADLSPASARRIVTTLRSALKHALRSSLIVRNVASLVELPRAEGHEVEALTLDHARRLIDAIAGHRWEAIFVLALASGMRQGEILGLEWSAVDLDGAIVDVRQQLQWYGGAFHLDPLKTKKSRRVVAIPAIAVASLRARKARQAEERLFAGPKWSATWDLVFTTGSGRPIRKGNLITTWHRLLERAGIPRMRFHDLRHGAATLLLQKKRTLREVQEILGHASSRTTADVYAHIVPDAKREAADVMDDVLGGKGHR